MLFSELMAGVRQRLVLGIATSALLSGLVACSTTPGAATTALTHASPTSHTTSHMAAATVPNPSVLHRQWRLHTVQNHPARAFGLQEAELTLEADQRMYGTTGCNRFFGTYSAHMASADEATHTGSLQFGDGIGMTRMACPDVQEHHLMQLLDATQQVRVTGQQLALLDKQGAVLTVWHAVEKQLSRKTDQISRK